MKRVAMVALLLLITLVFSTTKVFIVHVSSYEDETITSLPLAEKDAENFKDVMDKIPGVEIKLLENPGYTEFLKGFKEWVSSLKDGDMLIFYYAGHGISKEGEFHFIPSDADPEDEYTWIAFGRLRKYVRSDVRVVWLIDACYSGSIVKGRPLRSVRIVKEGFKARSKEFVITSSRGNEISREMPDESGGIFTIALVEGFKGKADVDEDGWVRSGELYNYVKKRVEELSKDRQHPLSSGSQDLKVIQTLKGKEKALKRETEALYTKGELTQIEYEKIKAIVEGKQCRGEGLEYVKEKIKKYLSEGTKEALEDIKTTIKAYESGIRCEGVKEPESEFTQYLSSKPEKAEKYIPEGDSILVLVPKNDALKNAEVYIDGKLAGRFEEDAFRIKVTSGKHVVRITSSRVEDLVFGFTVGHKEEYTKEIFGIVARRSITILSEPEGARVYVDGEYKGITHNDSPVTVYLTVAEKHRIRLEKEDYKPYETTFQIPSKGPVMTLRARLEHLKARLKITSDPPNVEVYLNDNYIGKTPLEYSQEKAIEGELILKKENYADFSLNVNIPLGNSESVSAKLYPIVSVKVETTPSGAKLYVDGKYAGVTPYFANFLGGAEHKIRLEKEEYETIEEVITLPDYPFAVVKSYRLEHLKAHLTIDSTPSDGEVYLNGEYIGKTPLEIIRESPIKGRLTLQKGYLYAEQDVNVALKEERTIKLTTTLRCFRNCKHSFQCRRLY